MLTYNRWAPVVCVYTPTNTEDGETSGKSHEPLSLLTLPLLPPLLLLLFLMRLINTVEQTVLFFDTLLGTLRDLNLEYQEHYSVYTRDSSCRLGKWTLDTSPER